jgi:hypothetical protein
MFLFNKHKEWIKEDSNHKIYKQVQKVARFEVYKAMKIQVLVFWIGHLYTESQSVRAQHEMQNVKQKYRVKSGWIIEASIAEFIC